MNTGIRELNAVERSMIYGSIQSAFAAVKNLPIREACSPESLDGEVYTRIRADLGTLPADSPLRTLFQGRRRNLRLRLDHLRQGDKEMIATMYMELRKQHLEMEKDEGTRLRELETLLAGMAASTEQMRKVAVESEAVRDRIDELEEMLEGR